MDDSSRSNAHLVGVCGSGMKALAELLLDRGWLISGSDLQRPNASITSLIHRGLHFCQGHRAENLSLSTQQLVYSSAVPPQNPERVTARKRGLPQFSYSQMVGRLMRDATGVCISGTHGKSTTTAMTASILDAARRLSSAVLGAELRENGRSGWSGPGDLFVVESCEFQRSFLDFHPKFAAILNVEPDHFDCYPDLESVKSAFGDFANQTASDGVIVFNRDCPAATEVTRHSTTGARRVSYGIANDADWTIGDCHSTEHGMRFALRHAGRDIVPIELQLHGMHNVQNALAAATVCTEIGVSPGVIADALMRFQGIRRRMEFVGQINGITLIDDYAHHPTAVKSTLGAIRTILPERRIVCVFQPHQISRTVALMDDFARSFGDADKVLLAPVFAARESVTNEPLQVSTALATRLKLEGVSACAFASLDQIVATLEDSLSPGDVIVTMGAGDIDRIHYDFTRRVQ